MYDPTCATLCGEAGCLVTDGHYFVSNKQCCFAGAQYVSYWQVYLYAGGQYVGTKIRVVYPYDCLTRATLCREARNRVADGRAPLEAPALAPRALGADCG